jgi:hypothetical protein
MFDRKEALSRLPHLHFKGRRMMRSAVVLFGLVSACHRPGENADAYRRWTDRMITRLGLPNLGIFPCPGREETIGKSKVYVGPPIDQCYKMKPEQRWTGLWRNEFEGSRFCPAPARTCGFTTPGEVVWLDPSRVTKTTPDGALYSVRLLGRRTAVKGRYGHMGGSDQELIVDRFMSMKKVGSGRTGLRGPRFGLTPPAARINA